MTTAPRIRRLDVQSAQRFASYYEWQSLYMDHATGWLIPDTEIWAGDDLVFKVNALGCKGFDVLPELPTILFLGDSATMGISQGLDNWPARAHVPGCQVLNGAIEGHNMDRAVERYQQLAERVDLAAIVAYTGWHNIIYGETGEAYWRGRLDELAGGGGHVLAICNLATCLTDECRSRGVEALLNSGVAAGNFNNYFEYNRESVDQRYFNFWCNESPTLERIGEVLDGIANYNAFLARYCAEKDVTLIDLAGFVRPPSYEAIPSDFFDVCHLRPAAYAKVGAFVADEIKGSIARHLAARPRRRGKTWLQKLGLGRRERKPASVAISRSGSKSDDDLRKNIYPLW